MNQRNKAIYKQYLEGTSVAELGDKYNLSKEHVQIVCDMGMHEEKMRLASKELLPMLKETNASPSMQARLINALVKADICDKSSFVEKLPDILSGRIKLHNVGSAGIHCLQALDSSSNSSNCSYFEHFMGSSYLEDAEFLPYGSLSFSIDSPSIGNAIQLIRDGNATNVEISHQVRVYRKDLPQQGRYLIRIDIQEECKA